MEMTEVLAKYDLDLSNVLSPDGLKKLLTAHSELVESLKSDSETQQNREKEIRDRIKVTTTLPVDTENEIRTFVAEIMAENPDTAILLVDLLQEIKSDVITYRDFHVASIARASKPDKPKGDEARSVRREEANTLRDTINSVWSLMGKPTDVDGLNTKKSEKSGETLLDLPRIPGGNETGNVGRGAVVRQMRFKFNGEDVPTGVLFYDLIQNYLNNFAAGKVYKVTDIKEMIENKGYTFAPKGYDARWKITVDGNTIEGWVPED